MFFLVGPVAKRMPDEAGITESGLVGDFASEPRRNRELAVGGIKLDLGYDQSLVPPGELVDFPGESAERHIPAAFEDNGLGAEAGEERDRVRYGDGILELGAGDAATKIDSKISVAYINKGLFH